MLSGNLISLPEFRNTLEPSDRISCVFEPKGALTVHNLEELLGFRFNPVSFIVDSDGIIVYMKVGYSSDNITMMDQVIERESKNLWEQLFSIGKYFNSATDGIFISNES